MENERNVVVVVKVETCVVVLRDDAATQDDTDDKAFLYADDTKRDTAFLFIPQKSFLSLSLSSSVSSSSRDTKTNKDNRRLWRRGGSKKTRGKKEVF